MVTVSDKARQQIAKKMSELHPATARAIKNDDFQIGQADIVLPCETETVSGGIAQLRKFLNQTPIYDNLNKSTLDVLKKAVNDPENIADYRWVLVKRNSLGLDYSNLQKKKELGYVEITKDDLLPDMQHVVLEKQTGEGVLVAMMCVKEHREKRLALKNQSSSQVYADSLRNNANEMEGRAEIKRNHQNIDIGNYA